MSSLRIAYLYPAEMNIYGDRGNIICLQQRCRWRGIETQLDQIHLGQNYDFSQADIIFGGGGQDKGQELVAQDLQRHAKGLQATAQAGTPMLLICGLYQLFGRHFVTSDGVQIPGIGIFRAETEAGQKRLIGNEVVESPWGSLVGFENHSGQTTLDAKQRPLGQVLTGHGNDGTSGREGAIINNVIGTYLHGPVLPKNPRLADHLILVALHRQDPKAALKPLDDSLELMAAASASHRPQ